MRLEFKPQAFEDLQFWVQTNPKLAKRVLRLIEETQRDPFGGVGKPEPLRGELAGWWSKRIDQEHRLIYQTEGQRLIIAQARGHYDASSRSAAASDLSSHYCRNCPDSSPSKSKGKITRERMGCLASPY